MEKEKEIILLSKYEDDILDACYNQDDMTTSDLQGVIQAIVLKIYREGIKNAISEELTKNIK